MDDRVQVTDRRPFDDKKRTEGRHTLLPVECSPSSIVNERLYRRYDSPLVDFVPLLKLP